MRTVTCPDCGCPAVELGRFTVDDIEYVRLRCGSGPALLHAVARLPSPGRPAAPPRGWDATPA